MTYYIQLSYGIMGGGTETWKNFHIPILDGPVLDEEGLYDLFDQDQLCGFTGEALDSGDIAFEGDALFGMFWEVGSDEEGQDCIEQWVKWLTSKGYVLEPVVEIPASQESE